jgi:hypothetical protein
MSLHRVAVLMLLAALAAACDSAGSPPSMGGGCPALTRDPQLESIFPAQIDGQPVVNVQSARFLETVCVEGGPSGVDAVSSRAPAGVDLSSVSIGSAETTLDSSAIRLVAYRVAGATQDDLFETVAGLAQAVGGDPAKFGRDLEPSVAGGKSVRTWTDAEGRTSYLYVSGDILVVVDGVLSSQADRILASF